MLQKVQSGPFINYDPFETASFRMRDVLRPCQVQTTDIRNLNFFIIPSDHPNIAGFGEHSVSFRFTDVPSGFNQQGKPLPALPLVVKLFGLRRDPDESKLLIAAKENCAPPFARVEDTLHALDRIEIPWQEQLVKPRIEQYPIGRMPIGKTGEYIYPYCLVMDDLTETGRLKLVDADGFDFGKVSNGSALERLFEEAVSVVLDAHRKGECRIFPRGHGTEEDPTDAIKHMFLVQYDPFNGEFAGTLLAADINHVGIKMSSEA